MAVVVSRVRGSAVLLIAGEAATILDPGVVSDDCRIGIRNSYPSGLGEWCHTTPGCDLAHEEGSTVSQACRPAKAVERLLRAKLGRLLRANIQALMVRLY